MRRAASALIALALVPHSSAAANASRARYLMGTVCEVAVAGSADAEGEIARAFDEARRIESFLSTWRDDTELARVNRGEIAPSAELKALLVEAEAWRDRTGGAFEPRMRPLIDAWRTREEGASPDADAVAKSLAAIRAGNAPVEEGGFGKGYAIDRMLARIDARSVLINFGGQLGVRGTSRVTIADPNRRDRAALGLTLTDASLSTSGGSEKTFALNGRLLTHIIDPRTGEALPPRGSVSVIAKDGLTADILSTALYVMGPEEGLRWANQHHIAALFIDTANTIRVSSTFRAHAHGLELLGREFIEKE